VADTERFIPILSIGSNERVGNLNVYFALMVFNLNKRSFSVSFSRDLIVSFGSIESIFLFISVIIGGIISLLLPLVSAVADVRLVLTRGNVRLEVDARDGKSRIE
jgi:uncharacterized membrane protein